MYSDHTSRQDRIFSIVQEHTQSMLPTLDILQIGIHAGAISEQLHMDRANIARELNELYRSGQLIKVQGKPTLYICRSILSKEYPTVFFPSSFPKNQAIQDYIEASAQQAHPHAPSNVGDTDDNSSLDSIVGAHRTLKSAILHAKAAVIYPSHDLHLLITGSTGVGKELFARKLYNYAIAKGSFSTDAPFITVNCSEQTSSPQLLLSQIFGCTRDISFKGEKPQKGLLERAAGGILYLNGIEKLPAIVQDAFITLIEKNTYTRIGEPSVIRYSNAMIIATSTVSQGSSLIASLRQRFSIRIHIPDLTFWSYAEISELLIHSFQSEAASTGLSFQISKDTFSLLLRASYPGNLGDLTSSVRTICALAFQDRFSSSNLGQIIKIRLHHIPEELLKNVQNSAHADAQLQKLFNRLELEYFVFTPTNFSTNRFPAAQFLKKLHQQDKYASQNQHDNTQTPNTAIPILTICHGSRIAEDMADYVNSALGISNITGISSPENMSFQELIKKVLSTAQKIAQGNGILLAVDMEPFTHLDEYVQQHTGIHTQIVSNINLPLLLSIGQMALQKGISLYDLSQEISVMTNTGNNLAESSFLDRTVTEILTPSLTFLNPYKAIDALSTTLNSILKELNITQSNDITIKFIFHGAHMLERLISDEPLKYDGLKTFINQNNQLFAILEKHMNCIAELFGVPIPANELAYIAEILLPYIK